MKVDFDYTLTESLLKRVKSESGVKPPSVTMVLMKTLISFDTWFEKLSRGFDFEAERERVMNKPHVKKAVSRGRRVANALDSGNVVTDDKAVNKVLRAIKKQMSRFEVIQTEVPLVCKDLYWGKADAVVRDGQGLMIADNKSVNKLTYGKDGVMQPSKYKQYALQVAAYAHAHNVEFSTDIKKAVVLFCSGDGTGKVETVDVEIRVDDYIDQFFARLKDYNRREALVRQRELEYFTQRM